MKTIAIFNQAGGVGKTTLTRDLGFELQHRGKNVLLIDADAQGSLSDFLDLEPFGRPQGEIFWNTVCEFEPPAPFTPFLEAAFGMTVGIANFSVIECEQRLSFRNISTILLDALETLGNSFDFILVDCPPSVHEIAVQVLVAADEILIPVQTEQKAFMGLTIVQNEIYKANQRRRRFKPPLRIGGVIPTIYNENRRVHRFYLEEIQKFAQDGLRCPLLPPVRDSIAVTEASNARKPLKLYKPGCPVNQDIEAIAESLTGRDEKNSPVEVTVTHG
ncbi:MAG: ParA family protein [Blastocatellia bacterium]|nr:ParA family protein [Blastocatellia bacterium]